MDSNQSIGVGLIGCGTVAQYGHLPTIAGTPGLKLLAVADTNTETAQAMGAKYEATAYSDYHDLLARDDIAAVTVSTPLPHHYAVAAAALKAGKHVFLEKPFADTPAHCNELVELAREHNRLMATNFEYRFDAGILKMRELLQSGELGALQVLRLVNNWSAHGVEGAAGERRARFMQDGGGSMDCGIHFMDLARFLSQSEFGSICARGQWAEPQFRGPGHMMIQARMESGVLALIESSFIYTHRSQYKNSFMQYEVIGERGVATWLQPLRTPGGSFEKYQDELHILTEDRTEVFRFSAEKQFAKTYAGWAQCIARGTMEGTTLATGEDGSKATSWMWRALEQAEAERAEQQSGKNGSPLA